MPPAGCFCSVSAPDTSMLGWMLNMSEGAACRRALGFPCALACTVSRLCTPLFCAAFCCLDARAFLLSTKAWTVASSCLRIFLACFSDSALTLNSRGPFAVLSWISKQSELPGFCVRSEDGSHLTITSKGNLSRCCRTANQISMTTLHRRHIMAHHKLTCAFWLSRCTPSLSMSKITGCSCPSTPTSRTL